MIDAMEELMKVFDIPGVDSSDEKLRQLSGYMEGILDFNESINLTAITDRKEFIAKHYIDSLMCAAMDEINDADTVIDVGTGGGFPGVPLAIAFPEKKFTLIDSLNKRIKIVNQLCDELEIKNVRAIHGRAEELARKKDMREQFDICVSRAVANMATLSEYCLPFVKVGGSFIAYKGPDCESEVKEASNAIEKLGGCLLRIERPEADGVAFGHRLIVVKKIAATAAKFPRKPGTPSKEPMK